MGAEMARGLVPTGLDQLWVADITYVRLAYVVVLLQQAGDRLGLGQASVGEPRHRGSQHGDHGTQACARQPEAERKAARDARYAGR